MDMRQTERASINDAVDVPRELELPSERVERELRGLIAPLDRSAQIPPLRELAERLGTSKKTVGKAVAKLADEGLLTTRGRWGTFKS